MKKRSTILWNAAWALGTLVAGAGAGETPAAPVAEAIVEDFEFPERFAEKHFQTVWEAKAQLVSDPVRRGKRSLQVATGKEGGTIKVFVADGKAMDFTGVQSVHLWVFDTQGSNNIELRLKDSGGSGGGGVDGRALWSRNVSVKGEWVRLEWVIAQYPKVPGLDLKHITSVEFYEFNPGIYYFDDLIVSRKPADTEPACSFQNAQWRP